MPKLPNFHGVLFFALLLSSTFPKPIESHYHINRELAISPNLHYYFSNILCNFRVLLNLPGTACFALLIETSVYIHAGQELLLADCKVTFTIDSSIQRWRQSLCESPIVTGVCVGNPICRSTTAKRARNSCHKKCLTGIL